MSGLTGTGWIEALRPWLEQHPDAKVRSVKLFEVLCVPLLQQVQRMMDRLGRVMRKHGFEWKQARINGKVSKCYVRGTPLR